MDMQAAISEKTRRALWDLLAERDTVDNTLSKASGVLAAAECFGINVDSDTFRSQNEIVQIEAMIKQNAASAKYPAAQSLITRLLDAELKRSNVGAKRSPHSTEDDPTLFEKRDDTESDIIVSPVIHGPRPKREIMYVESGDEEDVSGNEDLPLSKRRRVTGTSNYTGSCAGWPQELFEKFAIYKDSKWSQKKPLLIQLWADGVKDGELKEMEGGKACSSCRRTGDVCAVPPGVVGVRCLRCHAARPNSKCSLAGRYRRGERLCVSSSEDDTASTSPKSTIALKKESTHPASIQQTIENLKMNGNVGTFLNQLRDALNK